MTLCRQKTNKYIVVEWRYLSWLLRIWIFEWNDCRSDRRRKTHCCRQQRKRLYQYRWSYGGSGSI